MPSRVAGVVLAAGASRRLGQPKQLVRDAHGETMVARAVRLLREAGCAPIVVVTGAVHDAVADVFAGPTDVQLVHNAEWESGMASSIAAGITWLAADAQPAEAAIVMACDMPSVTAEHLVALRAPWESTGRCVASRYDEVLGIPALFPKADWTVLMALSGDRGARQYLNSAQALSVSLRNGNFDLDTPSDLERWRAHHPLPPSSMSAIAAQALADLDHEIANTRRMLALVPADHLDFTPHPKSWPLQKLANHLTDFGTWGEITLTTDELDFAAPMPPQPPAPTTAEGFLAQFDERIARFKAELAEATDVQMMGMWTMRSGDHVIMSLPRVAVLRSSIISHMIHHRAQLTMYYRLLDIPVPGLYGPSADEKQ